jgi:hypothetical protein
LRANLCKKITTEKFVEKNQKFFYFNFFCFPQPPVVVSRNFHQSGHFLLHYFGFPLSAPTPLEILNNHGAGENDAVIN